MNVRDVRFVISLDDVSIAQFHSWDFAYALFLDVTESCGRDPVNLKFTLNPSGLFWSNADLDNPHYHAVELLVK